MLKWLFGERAKPVTVNINDLFRRLDLYDKRFRDDPNAHIPVLDALGQYTLRGSSHYGPARSFYTDPQKVVTVRAPEKQFFDEPDPTDEHIRSSTRISFTEETRGFGKRAFALIIRREFSNPAEYDRSLLFGIFGVYDRDGNMRVKKIVAPYKDRANSMTAAKSIPLTPENVEKALRFAEICVHTLYRGETFHPRACLDEALRMEPPAPR